MDKKKILIVSRSFYPMNSPRSFRTTELVKEFARQGHKVTLLTVKNDDYHIPFEKKYGIIIRDLGPLQFPQIELNGKNKVLNLLKKAVRRALLLFFEYPDVELLFKVKKALETEHGYDLLISIAVPHTIHWGVARAWREENPIAKTWIADCGDPYMGQTLDSFNKMFYFKYFEKDFCRKADHVTVPIDDAKDGYYPEFRDKIRVIPQGFNFDEVVIDSSSYIPNRAPTFAYAGGFIPGGRDPRAFLEYLVGLDRDFKFIIYTKDTNLVEPWLERAKGRIEIRDYIPRPKLLQVLSKMDFLVNFENKSPLMMPSKLIDYYLTGRPVLNLSSQSVEPEKIARFLNGDYQNKLNYNGVDKYRIENVCARFLDLCNKNLVAHESS